MNVPIDADQQQEINEISFFWRDLADISCDSNLDINTLHIIFYRQLHFPSQPGVAKPKGSWENEAEICLPVAYVFGCFLHEIKEKRHFQGSEAYLLSSCLIFGQNPRLKLSN
jgi:hypothetical protein